jgi:hypothetical protein
MEILCINDIWSKFQIDKLTRYRDKCNMMFFFTTWKVDLETKIEKISKNYL